VSDRDIAVNGRILLFQDGTYYWQISHYWAGKESVPPYIPSKRSFKSLDDAENSILAYMRGFEGSVKIEINDRY